MRRRWIAGAALTFLLAGCSGARPQGLEVQPYIWLGGVRFLAKGPLR